MADAEQAWLAERERIATAAFASNQRDEALMVLLAETVEEAQAHYDAAEAAEDAIKATGDKADKKAAEAIRKDAKARRDDALDAVADLEDQIAEAADDRAKVEENLDDAYAKTVDLIEKSHGEVIKATLKQLVANRKTFIEELKARSDELKALAETAPEVEVRPGKKLKNLMTDAAKFLEKQAARTAYLRKNTLFQSLGLERSLFTGFDVGVAVIDSGIEKAGHDYKVRPTTSPCGTKRSRTITGTAPTSPVSSPTTVITPAGESIAAWPPVSG